MITDLSDMLPPLFARLIVRQNVEIGDTQLLRKRLHDWGGHRNRIVEKRSEIAYG